MHTDTGGKGETERERDGRKDKFAFHVPRRGRDPGCQNEGWNLAKKKRRRRHDPQSAPQAMKIAHADKQEKKKT